MELQDHFRPPLSHRRHRHAFHNAWATYLASDLNRRLPEGYFAEPNVQFGIEVAAFDEGAGRHAAARDAGAASVATLTLTAPAATHRVPLTVLDEIAEVLVFRQAGGPTLAAAVELVSPSNKDRPQARDAFVSKCAAALQQGIPITVVDVVTDRNADLHAQLIARLSPEANTSEWRNLWAASYRPARPARSACGVELEIWHDALWLGQALPTLALWLSGGLCFPLDLGGAYERTCREQRIRTAV